MAALRLPRGLIIDLITPITGGGGIDGRGLGKQLDRVLTHVQALFISSPYMGEGNNLGTEQREELFEKSLVVIRGRVPVFMWISRETDDKTRETLLALKKRLELRKYNGPVFWVDTPLYYHSNRGLSQHYEDMTSIVKEPFILHNDPDLINPINRPFKRKNIRTAILKDLALIKGIKGLIFLGTLDRAYNYQKVARARMDFRIYDGDESHFLEHPSLSGVVSRGANLAPKAWQKITVSSLNLNGNQGDYPDYLKQVWAAGRYLNNLKELYEAYGSAVIKMVLSKMGVIEDASFDNGLKDTSGKIKDLMEKHGDYS